MSIVRRLDWDSDFFNLNIGQLDVVGVFDVSNFEHEAKKFDLVYVFSSQEIKSLQPFCFLDKKVRYSMNKKVDLKFDFKNTQTFTMEKFKENKDSHEELLELVFASGYKSRFFLDKKMGRDRFERLYTRWIENGINDKENVDVFVIKEDGHIVAFVEQVRKETEMNISLIATSSNVRGNGYGRALVKKVIANFLDSDMETLSVYTQLDNKGACDFYEKMGFRLENVNYIYHHWA